jgi:hypothetical protein
MNPYYISVDPYRNDVGYNSFLRAQKILKIFRGEVIDNSHNNYFDSRWYKPDYSQYTKESLGSIAYTEYLSEKIMGINQQN